MTIRQHQDTPCWHVIEHNTNLPPSWDEGEGVPHYDSREKAEAAIGTNDAGYLQPAVVNGKPCLGIFCDGCGVALDTTGDDATHLDPTDPLYSVPLDAFDWTGTPDGKHYCWDCEQPDGDA